MIEEIAHIIFGPAGAVAAIVLLDSLGGNDGKPKREKSKNQQNETVVEITPFVFETRVDSDSEMKLPKKAKKKKASSHRLHRAARAGKVAAKKKPTVALLNGSKKQKRQKEGRSAA